MTFSRRDFVKTSLMGAVAASAGARSAAQDSKPQDSATQSKHPIIVCANNGFNYLEDAFAFLKAGGDTPRCA
jgi:anaerobic selenocysteine-containing dehydrogenase